MKMKSRILSNELKIMRSLNNRMNLTEKDKKYYLNLEKGYEGEIAFDQLTKKLQCDVYILNDLCLEYHNSVCQLDTLLILPKTIIIFELKNYAGDYHYEDEEFRMLKSNIEITNPVNQLKRSKTLLRSLLKENGIYFPVEGYVTFVNPEFTLYQAPIDASIILPTQLNRFINRINNTPSKLNHQHKQIYDLLMEMHLPESPYNRLPSYQFDQLEKGILCVSCYSIQTIIKLRGIFCEKCGYVETIDHGIMRSVAEFNLLFPDMKITTNHIHNWCNIVNSKKRLEEFYSKT
ncbi:nuclease-related domain-containing protein [Metabacillus malikii]|uniref:NERD domain-containing protein n=1 Tax=Metabacillus malikii TaxID=1504265 RepID=A0ABT9ZQL8_9BACI|nr:nuclease-related domain-containing protein [Metabacillus malikii]MDQ0233525.1 hypothetical protein [Metabacillus malikii]